YPLAGRVVDERGRPVGDALVHIEGDRVADYSDTNYGLKTTLEWSVDENERRTDRDGRFRFADLYDGEFELRASPPDAPQLKRIERARSGREDVELVLDRGKLERVVFSGSVTDAITGEPVREFKVMPMRRQEDGGAFGNSVQVSDEQGSFRLVG